jgi:predicted small secreted protein
MGKADIMKTHLSLSLLLIGAIGVAACDNNTTPKGINTLGKAFVRMFNQDRNSEPVDAQSVPMTLTPTIEPFNP